MLAELIPALAVLTPELVWGLATRGIGLILVISFLSLTPQVVKSAGSRGGLPIHERFTKIRKDFAAPARYLYFPTLLWISHRDWVLQLVPLVGLAAACVVVYGGPLGPWALLVCYVCYLTLDTPMALIFPWDCMLFETMILGLFLPATLPLPELAATAAPVPAVTWAFRLLLFRVMFGFGKNKFMGASKEDNGYLKGFLTSQPLPNYLGWYAQKLPMWTMRLLLVVMFIVEIPVPLMMLIPGDLSIIAAVTTALLMVGIISFGSFGYFSLVTIVGCIVLFDNETPTALSLSGLFGAGAPNFTNAFILLHTIGSLFVFPFNSWVGQSWSHWTIWLRFKSRLLRWPVAMLRILHPFRWLHPYGVFPPKSFPAHKGAVIVEVSWDGDNWHECEFSFFCSHERAKPRFVAPHHPRGDQAVIYETYGLNPTTLVSHLAGGWDPNSYSTEPAAAVLCQKVLEGHGEQFLQCEELSRRSEPPKLARVRTMLLEPAPLSALQAEGKYWQREYVGPHTPPREIDPEFWKYLQPEPEMWHPEGVIWRLRSRLGKLMRRAQAGEDIDRLVIEDGQVSESDVGDLWNDFLPAVSPEERQSWETLQDVVPKLRGQFDRDRMWKVQCAMGRYSALLEARLLPLYLAHGLTPKELPAKTYLHFWMLIQHIIAKGKATYDAVAADPKLAAAHLDDMTIESGMYFLCVFRYETMVFDAQKLRLMRAIVGPYGQDASKGTDRESLPPWMQKVLNFVERLFGYFEVAEEMLKHFRGPQYDHGIPERYPTFALSETGEVKITHWPPMPDIPGTAHPPK